MNTIKLVVQALINFLTKKVSVMSKSKKVSVMSKSKTLRLALTKGVSWSKTNQYPEDCYRLREGFKVNVSEKEYQDYKAGRFLCLPMSFIEVALFSENLGLATDPDSLETLQKTLTNRDLTLKFDAETMNRFRPKNAKPLTASFITYCEGRFDYEQDLSIRLSAEIEAYRIDAA
jgi:hypothetical protein